MVRKRPTISTIKGGSIMDIAPTTKRRVTKAVVNTMKTKKFIRTTNDTDNPTQAHLHKSTKTA